jgi:hypothetical protein
MENLEPDTCQKIRAQTEKALGVETAQGQESSWSTICVVMHGVMR